MLISFSKGNYLRFANKVDYLVGEIFTTKMLNINAQVKERKKVPISNADFSRQASLTTKIK